MLGEQLGHNFVLSADFGFEFLDLFEFGGALSGSAIAALESGHLAGAACDVFAIEPDANPRLLALPTFIGTPHIGGSAVEAQLAMGRAAIEGLETARVPGDGWPC